MLNKHLYKDCKTGREVIARFVELKRQEDKDIANAKEAHDNFFIHELMIYYNMPYREASQEFYRYGTSRMGLKNEIHKNQHV